jgi:hypothetical protein
MCNLGMTVVAVVHQPRYSLFQMFDAVLMLGQDKHLVYAGPTAFATQYFLQLGYEPQLRVRIRDAAAAAAAAAKPMCWPSPRGLAWPLPGWGAL